MLSASGWDAEGDRTASPSQDAQDEADQKQNYRNVGENDTKQHLQAGALSSYQGD